ncbi:MAG: glutamate-5-semialdehyde dehydrogenase [Anaerolineaceae bacterium]|nr:glutamate-5-semialdehyde dehydrogenase [Anaerolineaceae bacterium]
MLETMGKNARLAFRQMALAPATQRNAALEQIAALILQEEGSILSANEEDMRHARQSGLSDSMLDRLMLNHSRLSAMASDLIGIAGLADPLEEIYDAYVLPNGLKVHKRRVPLGVLAAIYEARPNVTIDIAGLVIKTGNVVILRGGSETIHSNRAFITVIQKALESCGLPQAAVQFIDDRSRERVNELLKLHEYVDLLIPRGSAALHKFCRENSQIPVITGGIGICHLYVEESANLDASLEVIRNAKVQRPTVCNALDTVLVQAPIATEFIPRIISKLTPDGVTFRLEPQAMQVLADQSLPGVSPAGPQDFDTEWLSLVLGIKVVSGLDEAIQHIEAHSTSHSDGILTENAQQAQDFLNRVDSSVVYLNASTRFTDGGQLGLGAEVAVSTQRVHARGPMGPKELTSYKWVVQGEYQVRQ